MDAWLVIGNPHTRKSSVIRGLSGCFNRSLRDIQLQGGRAPLRVYARVGTPQETRRTPEEFVAEVAATRCGAVLCGLLPAGLPGPAPRYPDAPAYVAAFRAAGWRIRAIAVLGQNSGGVRGPGLRHFPQAPTAPINLTLRDVRQHFGWE